MARYGMSDGTVVDTDNATAHWDEMTRWNGRNHISVPTGSEWNHESLWRSRKGRYYVERTSQWEGSRPCAEWVSNEEAARWLLENEREVPKELTSLVEQVSE